MRRSKSSAFLFSEEFFPDERPPFLPVAQKTYVPTILRRKKVREMRDADTILGIIQERGKRGLPLENIYRSCLAPAVSRQARSTKLICVWFPLQGARSQALREPAKLLLPPRFRWKKEVCYERSTSGHLRSCFFRPTK